MNGFRGFGVYYNRIYIIYNTFIYRGEYYTIPPPPFGGPPPFTQGRLCKPLTMQKGPRHKDEGLS